MKTVIIDCGGDVVLEDALVMRLVQHLQDAGHAVDHTNYCNNSVAMISTIAKEIADPVEVPALAPELPSAPEIAIELPPIELSTATEVPMMAPEVLPPEVLPATVSTTMFNVAVMNLSTFASISAQFNADIPISTLNVSNIHTDGEYVSFEYCGVWVKYPIERELQLPVCNQNPQFTPTSIRVAVKFSPSQIMYACLLSVVEKTSDTCSITLGSDLVDVVNHESETAS